jgi:hypothetical protein
MEWDDYTNDGLTQWKCTPARTMMGGYDGQVDFDNYQRIMGKLEDLDVQGLSKKYGLSTEERRAFEVRRRVMLRLMVDENVGEYIGRYHAMGEWPDPDAFDLTHLFDDLDKNIMEAEI